MLKGPLNREACQVSLSNTERNDVLPGGGGLCSTMIASPHFVLSYRQQTLTPPAIVNVRVGSTTDLQRHAHLRPLSGVKQTSNVRFLSPNRSCADDVRFRGQSGLSGTPLRMSAYSQKETFAGVEISSTQGPESTLGGLLLASSARSSGFSFGHF